MKANEIKIKSSYDWFSAIVCHHQRHPSRNAPFKWKKIYHFGSKLQKRFHNFSLWWSMDNAKLFPLRWLHKIRNDFCVTYRTCWIFHTLFYDQIATLFFIDWEQWLIQMRGREEQINDSQFYGFKRLVINDPRNRLSRNIQVFTHYGFNTFCTHTYSQLSDFFTLNPYPLAILSMVST